MNNDCPNGLLPDGPICPRCGGNRGPSGCDYGSWVHCSTDVYLDPSLRPRKPSELETLRAENRALRDALNAWLNEGMHADDAIRLTEIALALGK